MTTDIDDLEAKAKTATPGPWGFSDEGHLCVDAVSLNGNVYTAYLFPEADLDPDDADVQYIAAASPNVILDLIRRVREAEAGAVQRWKDANGYDDLLAAYSKAIDERDAALAERDALASRVREAEADRDSAHRMMEEAARRLDVDTDGLKPVHVFRAIDALRALVRLDRHHAVTAMCALEFRQQDLDEDCDASAVEASDVRAAIAHLGDALREHARKAGT